MQEEEGRRKIIYGIISAALFAVLFLASFRIRESSAESRYAEIVVFGDSVFGEIRDETAVPARLQRLLGKSVYNGAFGGTCAARTEPERRLDYTKDTFSLVGLAKSVYAGDFGVQQSIIMRESNAEYFGETIDGLDSLDFSKVEIFVIQHGINDYHAGTPIENEEQPYDERTFLGALRTAVDALRKVRPEARILLVTPLYTWYPSQGLTCEEADYGGGILADYVNAELELAEKLGLEVVDVYHNFYPHDKWEDWGLYSRDGMHPNDAGRQILAEEIAKRLQQIE